MKIPGKKCYQGAIIIVGIWSALLLPASGLDQTTNCWLASPGLNISTHLYYDIPAWNCNGSLLLIKGSEANNSGKKRSRVAYLVEELGTARRRLALGKLRGAYFQWDARNPDFLFYLTFDPAKTLTTLRRHNVRTDADEAIASASGDLSLAVPHPDGVHLLLIPKVGGTNGVNIVSLRDRKVTPVSLPAAVHRVRFTKHSDLSVFCNTETDSREDRVSYRLDVATGERQVLVKGQAGHPDWNPDGTRLSYFMDGGLCVTDLKGERLLHLKSLNGHQSWSPDGNYIVFDAGSYTAVDATGANKVFRGYISMVELSSQRIIPLVAHHSKSTRDQDTHPHPVFSPDGTKVVFNSNHDGKENPQAYVVRARRPDTVLRLTATREGNACRLAWEPSAARETKCFVLHRLAEDGRWVRFAEADRAQRAATDTNAAGVKGYGVVVEEYSGLQSEMREASLK